MSRYESELISQSNVESDIQRKWILELRLAAYFARRGEVSRARECVRGARSVFTEYQSRRIIAYVNFVEGVCQFIEKGSQASLEKFQRCSALCVGGLDEDDLASLVSAWLASAYRVLGDWSKVKAQIFSALRFVDGSSHETLGRISLVVADCFQETENYALADKWYRATRFHSTESGDDILLVALMFNRAAIRLFNLRISEVTDGGDNSSECRILMETTSAENYAKYVEETAMPWVFDLLRGQVLMLQGEYSQALALLDSPRAQALGDNWKNDNLVRRADVVRCKAKFDMIDPELIREEAVRFKKHLAEHHAPGDVAVSAYSLSVALKDIDVGLSNEYSDVALKSVIEFERQRAIECEMLRELSGKLAGMEKSKLYVPA